MNNIVVNPVWDKKSISKSDTISYDNKVLALYIIHNFIQALVMTFNSLSKQIRADFNIHIHFETDFTTHICCAFHGMRVSVWWGVFD